MSSNSLKMSFPMLDCQGEILKITTQSHVDHVNDTLTHFYGKNFMTNTQILYKEMVSLMNSKVSQFLGMLVLFFKVEVEKKNKRKTNNKKILLILLRH